MSWNRSGRGERSSYLQDLKNYDVSTEPQYHYDERKSHDVMSPLSFSSIIVHLFINRGGNEKVL